MNQNKYVILFTANIHRECINFKDLVIFQNQDKLGTRTFFKDMDRNGCHPKWKNGIPKGQFMRIKLNCDLGAYYETQTYVLGARFVEKGYQKEVMESTKRLV